MKSINKVRELASKNPYFTVDEVKRIVKNKKYVYLILHVLEKKGEIFRIGRGFYSRFDDPSLIVYYFKPAYIGLQDAMSYLNLWEQETIPIIITVRKVRRGIREILGNNVLVKRINPKYFFGFDLVKINELILPISNIEKTFIDLIYFREWKKSYKKYFFNKLDLKKLENYAKSYPKRIKDRIFQVLLTIKKQI